MRSFYKYWMDGTRYIFHEALTLYSHLGEEKIWEDYLSRITFCDSFWSSYENPFYLGMLNVVEDISSLNPHVRELMCVCVCVSLRKGD